MERSSDRLARALAEIREVPLAFLFGSRARGRARGGRLGREVSSQRLDLVLLNDAPILLRHRVLRDGIVLFQRSPEERARFTVKTIREYQDGFIRRAAFTRKRIERLKSGVLDGGPGDLLEKARGVARLLGKAQGVS